MITIKYVSLTSFRTRFYTATNILQQSGNKYVENISEDKSPIDKLNRIKAMSKKVATYMIILQPTGSTHIKTS